MTYVEKLLCIYMLPVLIAFIIGIYDYIIKCSKYINKKVN